MDNGKFGVKPEVKNCNRDYNEEDENENEAATRAAANTTEAPAFLPRLERWREDSFSRRRRRPSRAREAVVWVSVTRWFLEADRFSWFRHFRIEIGMLCFFQTKTKKKRNSRRH